MSSSSLPELWLRGVAANPAAPSEVLLRPLAPQARAAWTVLCGERTLPPEVVEAVLAYPERPVRDAFARNRHAAPAQRGRLVDDPDSLVRAPWLRDRARVWGWLSPSPATSWKRC
jgi:hypothetical protein